jgi:hypothetical protein
MVVMMVMVVTVRSRPDPDMNARAMMVMMMVMPDHNLRGPGAAALCQSFIIGLLAEAAHSGSDRAGRDSW